MIPSSATNSVTSEGVIRLREMRLVRPEQKAGEQVGRNRRDPQPVRGQAEAAQEARSGRAGRASRRRDPCIRTYVRLPCATCSSGWMPPTGSSSWSRNGGGRSTSRRRPGGCSPCGSAPVGLARNLLEEVVGEDSRLAWRGDAVGLADPPGAELLLENATFVVVDLETTGLHPGTARICEIGAVRVRELELRRGVRDCSSNPGVPLGPAISALTGLRDAQLRGQPHPRHRGAPLSRVRGRRRARRAQRALRPRLPRLRDGAAGRRAARRARSSTRSGLRAGCWQAAHRAPGSRRCRSSSAPPTRRAIARFPTRRRRPRS